ncbi:MAG: dTMP kinase [Candidatus Omnitrophica bacterium]|nr:dTMP kinase [Candidatus Omnitrophota bacterium]
MGHAGAGRAGKFITFEGPEGSGKSTHARLIVDFLKQKKIPVVFVREPGGTKLGERIRKLLLDTRFKRVFPETELFLYMAARSQLMQECIAPRLTKGVHVICDRFLDATIAYQGYGGGIDIRHIRRMGRLATMAIRPDLTLLLDLPVQEGLRRAGIKGRADRMEQKSLLYHRRVRQGYRAIAEREPRRVKVISTRGSVGAVQDRLRGLVLDVITR